MARVRSFLATSCLAFAVASCGGPRAPAELDGLWSTGQAACAAGVGVRFGSDAIAAVYDSQQEVLFDRPRYDVERGGADAFVVRITYDLPHRPGGARARNAHGVLVLTRAADGGLRPLTHHFVDGLTGAGRLRVGADPAMSAMTLEPCGPHPWREELRGRSGA